MTATLEKPAANEAITTDTIYEAFQRVRANHNEPDSIVVSADQLHALNVSLRKLELCEDPLLFSAFCAGYEMRRSAKVKISARVIREFSAFCGEMARAQVEATAETGQKE